MNTTQGKPLTECGKLETIERAAMPYLELRGECLWFVEPLKPDADIVSHLRNTPVAVFTTEQIKQWNTRAESQPQGGDRTVELNEYDLSKLKEEGFAWFHKEKVFVTATEGFRKSLTHFPTPTAESADAIELCWELLGAIEKLVPKEEHKHHEIIGYAQYALAHYRSLQHDAAKPTQHDGLLAALAALDAVVPVIEKLPRECMGMDDDGYETYWPVRDNWLASVKELFATHLARPEGGEL